MNKRHFVLNIFIILFLGNTALFAEDLVVPTIKAPYTINNAQFDNTGDYFAYEVNGKIYIRDSLSMVLKDSFLKDTNSNLSPFYTTPERVDYPKSITTTSNNSVTIQTKKSASSTIESTTINDLPAKPRYATVNRNKTHMAFLAEDGNAYIYNLNDSKVISKTPYNLSSSSIKFTSDNKVIFSDTSKTVGIFNINGQKQRSFTSANSIRGFNLSSDNDTLIIHDASGNLNFYNTNSSTQYGYIPNMGSKLIKNVELSKDSRRILITGENNSLYIAPLQDVLFAQNTVAPTPKQFAFNYNDLIPNKNGNGVTEFGVKEYKVSIDNTDAEYILSTREKDLGKQIFDLEEEYKPSEAIVLTNQPEQAYFPPSIADKDRDVLFTDRNNDIVENQVNITEYKQPQNYQIPVPSTEPITTIVTTPNSTITQAVPYPPVTSTDTSKVTTITDSQTGISSSSVTENPSTVIVTGTGTTSTIPTAVTSVPTVGTTTPTAVTAVPTVVTTTPTAVTTAPATELTAAEKRALAKAERNAEKEAKKAEKEAAKAEEKLKKNEEEKKDEKKSLKETLKEIHDYEDKEVQLKYKDGHGILFNVGISKLPAPFILDVNMPIGYRNYDLIKPFYFGGSIEPYIGFPQNSFPYRYTQNGHYLTNPKLLGTRFYAPIGFCMYPLKNNFEVYAELNLGISLNCIWNTRLGSESLTSTTFPSFYSSAKIGAAWRIANISICGTYDALYGVSFAIEAGIIINIGGLRSFLHFQSENSSKTTVIMK